MTWQHPVTVLSVETQKHDSALQNKIELIRLWPDSSCSLISCSRRFFEIISLRFDASRL